MTGRTWLPKAVIPPAAAYVMDAKKWAEELRAMARERAAYRGQEWLARDLLLAAEELEQSGRAWFAAQTVNPDAPVGEPGSPGRELTSREASEVLHLGVRQVTKLADAKAIVGRRVGRRWLLEEWSVLAYRDRASSERGGRRNSA